MTVFPSVAKGPARCFLIDFLIDFRSFLNAGGRGILGTQIVPKLIGSVWLQCEDYRPAGAPSTD